LEDYKIVQLFWDRNESAIPITARKYENYCTAIANNILQSREDTEECVNDTWLHAWNAMPPHRPQLLSAFLGKITRNLAFHRYQYRSAGRRGGGTLPAVLEELENCISGTDSVEQELDELELVRAINEFLAELTPEKRKVFVCRYWYADSVSDIAARYHLRPGTVSMTLSRLRDRLRDYLSERGFAL